MTDYLRDMKVSTQSTGPDDRQVFVGPDGDMAVTSGTETVEQSVAISAGRVLRDLIGNPITTQVIGDVEAELTETLRQDPQLDGVRTVNVSTIDKTASTIEVDVITDFNESFTLEVTT